MIVVAKSLSGYPSLDTEESKFLRKNCLIL